MKQLADPAQVSHNRHSLKTQLPLLGLTTNQVKEIAREFLKAQGHSLSTSHLYSIARDLWTTGYLEARILGLLILRRFEKHYDERTWRLADRWLKEIDDWSLCDTLCVCLTAPMLENDPSKIEELIPWTASHSPWRRRAALMSLRRLNRQGMARPAETLRLCEQLMEDADWPVRRALGFTLRDIGAAAPEALTEFLKQWKPKAHRWVIREATKKLSPELRDAVLSLM